MGTTTSGRDQANRSGYALLDHTADVGLRAWGPEPADALAAAARGMYAIILGREPAHVTGPPVVQKVTVSGDSWPDVVVNWLAELLFLFSVDGIVAQSCAFHSCALPACTATVAGVRMADELYDGHGVEIKAVTYHQVRVNIRLQHTILQVLFDI